MMVDGVGGLLEFVRMKKSGHLEADRCLWNGRSTSVNCDNKFHFCLLNGGGTFYTFKHYLIFRFNASLALQ